MEGWNAAVALGVVLLILKETIGVVRILVAKLTPAKTRNNNSTTYGNPHGPSPRAIWEAFTQFREDTNRAHEEAGKQRGELFEQLSDLRERAAGLEARVNGLEKR